MRIAIISDRPDHSTLAAYTGLVRARGHHVAFVPPDTGAGAPPDAAVCLLKSRTPQALVMARQAHAAGARVLNDADATAACLDRLDMAERARAAGLPFPHTYAFARPAEVRAPGHLIMKQRRTHRGEPTPVRCADRALRAGADDWPADEPVIVQEFADGDGWDHKLWVIGDRVFAGLRRSPLTTPTRHDAKHTVPVPDRDIPPAHRGIALAVGECFGLAIYGLDVIATAEGPRIVDINAFPGFRSLPAAPETLARFTTE